MAINGDLINIVKYDVDVDWSAEVKILFNRERIVCSHVMVRWFSSRCEIAKYQPQIIEPWLLRIGGVMLKIVHSGQLTTSDRGVINFQRPRWVWDIEILSTPG